MKIVSVAEMRALEAAAFAAGVSEAELQERAGTAIADEAEQLLTPGDSVVLVAGPGNNGRDAAVAARVLATRGWPVELFLGPRHAIRMDEISTLRALSAHVVDALPTDRLDSALRSARVAVDGLLGIGASGPMRDSLAPIARAINSASAERGGRLAVLALDIPSGIDADTGAVPGEVVRATLTVTLGAVKQGLLQFPAAELVGRLLVRGIGLDEANETSLPFDLLDETAVRHLVPNRPIGAHKYHFGRSLVVAGSARFPGAAVLCVSATARAGAGVVIVGCTPLVQAALAVRLPEATYTERPVDPVTDPEGALETLLPALQSASSIVMGPGFGRAESTLAMAHDLLDAHREHNPDAPLVIDADALYALAQRSDWSVRLGPNVVLTPHSGELALLAGPAPEGVPVWQHAQRLAREWGCVLVAKGPYTVIASPSGSVAVWPHANPALATGGTGDVLAGLIGGLSAQGLPPFDAARLAVVVHARAARAIQQSLRWRTLLAGDLLDEIPAQLAQLSV